MEDISLHILDIAENSIAAGARNVGITVREDVGGDMLYIEITDDGKGMSKEVAQQAADPFFTTRTTRRVGLGLALLREAAIMANGAMEIHSAPGSGTTVTATFQLRHIDRKPLGRMAETILALIATSVPVDILYIHSRDGKKIVFDTKEVRKELDGVPLNSVAALSIIREHLTQEEAALTF